MPSEETKRIWMESRPSKSYSDSGETLRETFETIKELIGLIFEAEDKTEVPEKISKLRWKLLAMRDDTAHQLDELRQIEDHYLLQLKENKNA